ncbi:MAG: hypothetical protein M1833_001866 [Piccolia ochrophora]|nr:MAG: hypothetical protein M1833_001866 [Piccolia ochrophora]
MSSPPHLSSISPPYPAPSSLPSRKRPSTAAAGPGSNKRRKASIASTSSLHPLRQTSFPPDEGSRAVVARSPSVSSSVVGGGPGSATTARGRRGRKSANRADDTAASSVAGTAKAATEPADEDEEDDEADGEAAVAMMGRDGPSNAAEEEQERQKLRILVESFSEDQANRYDAWRRAKLNPAAVKRLANQTLSQSIPDPVVKALSGLTKVFIAELVEQARSVQAQWDAGAEDGTDAAAGAEGPTKDINGTNETNGTAPSKDTTREHGPLLPDHLREALRRYREDREGGGAGMKGLSLASKGGVGVGGRRLFR